MKDLTQEVTKTLSLHDTQLATLTAKMESNHQQLLNTIAAHKQDEEGGTDQLVKAMKLMVTGELQKSESSLNTEIRFMVEQLQLELQQDIKTTQHILQKDQEQLFQKLPEVTGRWMNWTKRYLNSSLK